MSTGSKCCIIGIPDHVGVVNVGGRLGAAEGPKAFRKIFSRFHCRNDFHSLITDHGNVPHLNSDIVGNHKKAAEFIYQGHRAAELSVIVGGSHDHGYSHLVGILKSLREKYPTGRLGCINIDAHLDVRKPNPTITSGSPFYLALEDKTLSPHQFIEFGIQSHCNASELWTYIDAKGTQVIPYGELRFGKAVPAFKKALSDLTATSDWIVVSLDLDALAQAYSPGVSAPQAEGFNPSEILEFMEIAGRERKVNSLGIFELNPVYDRDDSTARIAATSAFHFLQSALNR